MIELYDGSEYPREKAAKKRFLTIWLILLGAVVLFDIGMIVWLATLPYQSPLAVWPKAAAMVLSCVFAFFSFPVLSIKFRRLRFYTKMLGYLETGLREGSTGELKNFSTAVEVREGVDYHTMITFEYNERKREYFERKVLIDCEKPLPDIQPGEMVHYITQGNILVSYETLPRPADEPSTEEKIKSVMKKNRREELVKCRQ